MNPVFKDNHFWNLFWNLEPEEMGEFSLKKQIEILNADFAVEKEIFEDFVYYNVKFPFSCGDHYSLLLECSLSDNHGFSCSKSLQLKDNLTKKTYELGWWDMARWHPYCLRPEEFRLLLLYWETFDSLWKSDRLPLLLLIHFVGFETKEQAISFWEEAEKFCESIGVSADYLQTENWAEWIENEKYRWSFDQKLGWTIGNKDYSCYSLRNRDHFDATKDEEHFPFIKYNKMMQSVYDRLNS